MPTSRPFCYNPSPNPLISGTEQVGSIAAATGNVSINANLQWWNGPDEDLGYVIAYVDPSGERPNAPERTFSTNYVCNIGFFRSAQKTEQSFIDLTKLISGSQSLSSGTQSKTWLNNNGYWTSYQPSQPWSSIDTIATYLRNYMSEFRNPSFYFYQLDGNGTYITDGGSDMYDTGNFTTPWLISNTQYTSSSGSVGNFPSSINYTNTTSTLVDTDFYYTSLGYIQYNGSSQSGGFHPLTVIGSRKNTGPVGWQSGGNSGADGGGTLASGQVWGGTLSNGFTTWAYYRQTYNAGDPSHCNLIILLGHSNWSSVFGQINSFADPVANGGNGVFYYSMTASNILAVHTLLSKSGGVQVTLAECQTVVSAFTSRIKLALNF
jgi:hypothetical protein